MTDSTDKSLDVILDRFKNPFLLAFAIAWILWNWKGIAFFFFTDLPIEDRFERIETTYFEWGRGLLYPLTSGVVYAGLLNFIMYPFDWLSNRGAKHRGKLQHKRELDEYDDIEEKARREFKIAQVRAGKVEMQELNNKVAQLENSLQEKQNDLEVEIKKSADSLLTEGGLKLENKILIEQAGYFGVNLPINHRELDFQFYSLITLIDSNNLVNFYNYASSVFKHSLGSSFSINPNHTTAFLNFSLIEATPSGVWRLSSNGFMVYILLCKYLNEGVLPTKKILELDRESGKSFNID